MILCYKVSISLDLQDSNTDRATGHLFANAYSGCAQTVREVPTSQNYCEVFSVFTVMITEMFSIQ